MENDPTIRRYRPGDGGQVRELHETTMRDTGAYVDTVSDTDLERVFETYVDGDGEFLVGALDGSVVAMGGFRPVKETDYIAEVGPDLMDGAIELTRMRVAPDYQRRGYGRRIYAELEKRARSQGATQIVLDTMAKTNRSAPTLRGAGLRRSPPRTDRGVRRSRRTPRLSEITGRRRLKKAPASLLKQLFQQPIEFRQRLDGGKVCEIERGVLQPRRSARLLRLW